MSEVNTYRVDYKTPDGSSECVDIEAEYITVDASGTIWLRRLDIDGDDLEAFEIVAVFPVANVYGVYLVQEPECAEKEDSG